MKLQYSVSNSYIKSLKLCGLSFRLFETSIVLLIGNASEERTWCVGWWDRGLGTKITLPHSPPHSKSRSLMIMMIILHPQTLFLWVGSIVTDIACEKCRRWELWRRPRRCLMLHRASYCMLVSWERKLISTGCNVGKIAIFNQSIDRRGFASWRWQRMTEGSPRRFGGQM